MANVRRLIEYNDTPGLSLSERAKQQDIDRAIQEDAKFLEDTGINRDSKVIPPDVIIPCNTSRLDIDPYKAPNPNEKIHEAYLQRQERVEIEEYQKVLKESKDNFVNSIVVMSFDPLDL